MTMMLFGVGSLVALGVDAPQVMAQAQSAPAAASAKLPPLRIGIIGTGHIGGSLARHWAKAGHEIMISSRHPDELKPLAAELGANVKVGTPEQAAAFGDVILVSVPYGSDRQ
jgi:lactate dehydrogenase-like 2-hydroxyacid dehydrogenase